MVTRKEYEELCDEVWRHNRLYFQESRPEISDDDYDRLVKKLGELEEAHPDWISPTSPTQRIGEKPLAGFPDVTHSRPMLSLEKAFSRQELESFTKRLQKLLGTEAITLCTELKMDGLAISVTYEEGRYVQAVTRGDGKVGSDVTGNVKTLKTLPLRLHGDHIPKLLEIRGEVYLPKAAFERMNEERSQAGEPLWANPRNAAAGSLKLLDPRQVAAREDLSVIFYGIGDVWSVPVKSQYALPGYFKSLGLPTSPLVKQCHTLDEVMAFAALVEKKRADLPFGIDGIVIKLDDLLASEDLGTTGKHPRGAIAYKFSAEQAWTRVRDIVVQVGRTGVLTPLAELEPVLVAGSTISRATLHNFEDLERKGVRVGDWVAIEKGGDVIPKVVTVDLSRREPHSKPFPTPTHCPVCGTPVVSDPEEVALRCPNRDCPEQIVRRLGHFASKNGLDIEHLGEKIVEILFAKGFVRRFSDIFRLTPSMLVQLEGFKEKSITNLLGSIEKAKKTKLAQFLMALGIRYVGSQVAELLAHEVRNLEKLMRMEKEELLSLPGIGDTVATSLVDYFADAFNRSEIEELVACGLQFEERDLSAFQGHPFFNKTIVITGTLETFSRHDAEKRIEACGGRTADTVSKKTDFLVVGAEAGSKLEKAKKLRVCILSEKEFLNLLDSSLK